MDVAAQIEQLNQAKQIVLQSSEYFAQIIEGIIPICYRPESDLQEWLSQFLSEAFARADIGDSILTDLALKMLEPLPTLFSSKNPKVKANTISICSSIYPRIFAYACSQPEQAWSAWDKLCQIKTQIIKDWETDLEEEKIMNIKFAQKVVLTQTVGIRDPRRRPKNDISLTNVAAGHPYLMNSLLEAEAHGLLDRILGTLSEEKFDYQPITAVLNAVPPIAKSRISLAPKIINCLLVYKPLKVDLVTIDLPGLIQMRSTEKTCRIVLNHIQKFLGGGAHIDRIRQYLLAPSVFSSVDVSDTIIKKRSLENASEPESAIKRVKPYVNMPHIEIEPHKILTSADEWASIFRSIAFKNALAWFDVTKIPSTILSQVLFVLLQHIEESSLSECTESLLEIIKEKPMQEPDAPIHELAANIVAEEESDDDYEPVETEDWSNAENNAEKAMDYEEDSIDTLKSFQSLPPQLLKDSDITSCIESGFERLYLAYTNAPKASAKAEMTLKEMSQLQVLSVSNWNRQKWTALMSRLPTRGFPGPTLVNGTSNTVGGEYNDYPNILRQKLFDSVVDNFKDGMDLALSWLSEEWYNEQANLKAKSKQEINVKTERAEHSNYEIWTKRILDHVIPFLENKDRHIIVFFSELPELTPYLVNSLRMICLDPDKSKIGYLILQYLVSFRPPCRNLCLDLIEQLWRENHEDIRTQNEKFLKKWRPNLCDTATV